MKTNLASMKRFLACALLAVAAFPAFALTLIPVPMLNPVNSTSGQVIASTGPTTAPAWTSVTLSGLGGLAKASNLSDVANTATALTNLGGLSAATAASTYGAKASPLSQFAATTSAQLAGVISDETGTGSLVFSISPALTGTPTATTQGAGSNSTAIATTAFVQTSFAAPPAIGSTTPGAGAFTTVTGTSVSHSLQEIDLTDTWPSPTTGTTVTLTAGQESVTLIPAGTLAALTISLPQCNTAYNGSVARFSTTQTITALTVSSPSSTVVDPATTLAIGAGHAYKCRSAATAWYPLY